ncbi:hypothetical protein [Nocardia beijingensis]|uniref:hypothetical protein n=1 Tax=Nocardia beijingensis TaxID=95162 RepID=UPI001E5759EA|nr:hypothetical protein [Nocardia beijingensis]
MRDPIPLRVARRVGSDGQLAGLRLRERWDGWAREPFTGESRGHVSVWQKIAD